MSDTQREPAAEVADAAAGPAVRLLAIGPDAAGKTAAADAVGVGGSAMESSVARQEAQVAAELSVHPDDPLHQWAEVEVDPDGATVEYVSDFDGELSVWAASESVDATLRLELDARDEPIEDDNSGGGTTAWLLVEVEMGERVSVEVRAIDGARGVVDLHLVASPETDETRAAAEAAAKDLEQVTTLQEAGEVEAARELVGGVIDRLLSVPDGARCAHVARVGWSAGLAAYRLADNQRASAAWGAVHTYRGRVLPADHPHLLRAKQNLGVTRRATGDLAGAHALFEHVHAAHERLLPADHPDLLMAKQNLALTRSDLGDLAGALVLREHVHAACERMLPADHSDLLSAKINLATMRSAMGDLEGALALREHVHAARERLLPPDHPSLLSAKNDLALTRRALGDLDGALALQEHAHAARERLLPADHPSLLTSKENLALTRSDLGDLAGALVLREHVHAMRESLLSADHADLLDAKNNLAATRYALRDIAGAHDLFEYVHAARERLLPADHPSLLVAKQGLAATRKNLGDLAGALELSEHVHAARERLLSPDDPDLLAAKSNLAVTRSELGDLAGALALFEQVHAARERLLPPDHPDLLDTKQGLAGTRKNLGDLAGAHALFEYLHAARERLLPVDHRLLLRAKLNLAGTRSALGDLAGALELSEQVHAARERLLPSDHPDLLRVKQNLAVVRSALGDLAGALALEEHVHAAHERLLPADHPELLYAKNNLAATRYKLGDLAGLRAASASLLSTQSLVCDTVSTHAPRLARSAALRELDRLENLAFWSEALTSNDAQALTAELATTLESLRQVSTASVDVARAAAEVPELDGVRVELGRVRRELADASFTAPSESEAIEAWRSRLHALAEERDGFQRQLRLQLEALGLGIELPTVATIAADLDENEVHVSFWRYDRIEKDERKGRMYTSTDSLLAFVVNRDGEVERLELGPAAPIEEAVTRWRASANVAVGTRGIESSAPQLGSRDGAEEAGTALRALVLDPVFAADPEARELRIVLDDVLFLVPLDALPLEDGVVGDRYTIRVGSTVRQLATRDVDSSGEPSLLVLGGVDYAGEAADVPERSLAAASPPRDRSTGGVAGASFTPLPGAASEAAAIAKLFQGTFEVEPRTLLAKNATKAALADGIEDARYLHIATHGWFAPDSAAASMLDRVGESDDALRLSADRAQDTVMGFLPETLCGLALAGANNGPAGILTAEELQTLDLTNCDLAVLSACETNVGIRRAGQGIQSLQTALHAAGARTAITSLWKVDDAATRTLFTVFYTKLWKEGLGKADALWQAKQVLRDAGHPLRDWAGWVLTGAAG